MSKAYWIVRVSVRDEQRYPEYLAAAGPAFQKFGAKFVVRGGAFETMEGNARERNVVVEFKDRATAPGLLSQSGISKREGDPSEIRGGRFHHH